jgi:LysR family transcriptional repressor of citA
VDPRHLRSFLAVAEQGSFRRAAERLYLSQPTVTAHIQALEREVGAALLRRGGRAARLTPLGERLLPYARRILALEREAVEELRAWRLGYDERLRVVCSIFVAASALPRALRRLLEERPRVDVALRTAFSADVLRAVAEGEADLGLSRLPPPGQGLEGRQVVREPVVAVAPAAWGPVALGDALARHPLLTHNHPGYWDRLLAQLQALGLTVRPMEVRQVEVTRRLVEEGLGLSFLPRSAVEGSPGLQVLEVPPALRLPEVGTWAVWPAGHPPSPAGERLVVLLAERMIG